MAKLEKPRGLTINFKPSERQYELWKALQPGVCECGGKLEMRPNGFDAQGHQVYKATCTKCGSTDIPEQVLGGGAAGGGKQTPLESSICTPFGFRKVKDLKIGDIITDPMTGAMQRIIFLHPITKCEYYRVHFVDNTYIDCSSEHLWVAHTSRHKSKKAKKYGGNGDKIWVTETMYQWYQKKKEGHYKGQNLIIPLPEPIQFTHPLATKNYKPVDPYILGALLGNGCMTQNQIEKNKYISYTTMDSETVERFEAVGICMDKWAQKPDNKAKDYFIDNKELIEGLKKIGVAGHGAATKFIPQAYKYATIEERKELMRGLFDTDGYVDSRGHMIYTTISPQLAEDVAFVVRSLGGKATVTKGSAGYKDSKGEYMPCQDAYDVYIQTKFNPELVHVTRKRERTKYEFNGGNSELGMRITDIEPIGKKTGRCITVDSPSGLFVADNFKVTHNSYLGCAWLVLNCMQFDGIRMVVARKERKTLIDTTWRTLNDVLAQWGLKRDIHYRVDNLRYAITFWNGSEILAMHLTPSPNDPDFNSLGSLEITSCFIDEVSEVSEKAVEVLSSRVRYKVAETFVVGKTFMSTNPCLGWVRDTFVMDENHDPVQLPSGYRYIPFSLFDNPNEKFRAIYYNKLSKLRNKADRDRLLFGNWEFTEKNTQAAYWNFDGEKHLAMNVQNMHYDPLKPLILSFDFNLAPYMSCLPMQIDYDDKYIFIFPEYIGYPKDKRNNTEAFSAWIGAQLVKQGHIGGILITGDPAGRQGSTMTEEGTNNYTIISKNLSSAGLRPKLQLLSKQPSHVIRLEFINAILSGFNGWRILIDARCHRLIEDFSYQKKNPDGTKEKKKILNEAGIRVEKWGHFSDCLDYAMVYYLNQDYTKFKTSGSDVVTTIGMDDTMYGDFEF